MSTRLDHDRLSRRTKAQILDEVEGILEETDKTHHERLRVMARSSMRMARDADGDMIAEITRLAGENADLERRLEMALEENRRLRGETTAAYNFTTRQEV